MGIECHSYALDPPEVWPSYKFTDVSEPCLSRMEPQIPSNITIPQFMFDVQHDFCDLNNTARSTPWLVDSLSGRAFGAEEVFSS